MCSSRHFFLHQISLKKQVWINLVDAEICCPSQTAADDDPWGGTPPRHTWNAMVFSLSKGNKQQKPNLRGVNDFQEAQKGPVLV